MSNKVNFKKKEADFPTSNIDNDTLYFKTDTNCMQMKLGNMPLRNDVIDLVFTHNENSTESHCILEATSDYITNLHDGLKIIIRDISDSSTVGYRFGTSTTSLEINGSGKRIFGLASDEPLTSSQIEPGTSQYTLMLQYSSSINYNSGGWIIVGQYNTLPISGGQMTGDIDMDGNAIANIPIATKAGDPVEYTQTVIYNSILNAFNANNIKISNVASPRDNLDAVNKIYVDTQIVNAKPPTLLQDTSVSQIDGSKEYNVAIVYGSAPIIGTLGFSTSMNDGSLCHIFVYCAGANVLYGNYDTISGYVQIPSTICVGGQSDCTSSNNYVWINGILVHGGGTAADPKYFKIPKEIGNYTKSGILEISVFYSQFTPTGGSLQHRTIIKIDGLEVGDPRQSLI